MAHIVTASDVDGDKAGNILGEGVELGWGTQEREVGEDR